MTGLWAGTALYLSAAVKQPPPPPKKEEDESLIALILVGLPVTNLILLTILAFIFWRRRKFWVAELHHLVDQIKEELPTIIVGEILTRWDVERMDKRLGELETTVGWLEEKVTDDGSDRPTL